MALGLWGGESRERPPLPFTMESGDRALPGRCFAETPSSSSTRESMMSCRSRSMELTRALGLPREAFAASWLSFLSLWASVETQARWAHGWVDGWVDAEVGGSCAPQL